MPWTIYAIFIVLGLFILLMIVNPRLSCFGRKISSPLYPIMRKKKQRTIQAEDYGFSLVDEDNKIEKPSSPKGGFDTPQKGTEERKGKKVLKTEDYGFHLGGDEDTKSSGNSAPSEGNPDK